MYFHLLSMQLIIRRVSSVWRRCNLQWRDQSGATSTPPPEDQWLSAPRCCGRRADENLRRNTTTFRSLARPPLNRGKSREWRAPLLGLSSPCRRSSGRHDVRCFVRMMRLKRLDRVSTRKETLRRKCESFPGMAAIFALL